MSDKDPWVSSSGELAHPDSPRGGGGAGRFREAGPYGTSGDLSSDPHPHSPVGRTLLAQNLSTRDAGTFATTKPQSDAGSKSSPNPPVINLESPPRLTKTAEADDSYKDVLRQHYFKFMTLSAEATVSVPAEVMKRGEVAIGFIQNVLGREMKAKYQAQKEISWKLPNGALLDIGDDAQAGDFPWMADSMRATIDSKSGDTASISYGDTPGAHYWNFYNDVYDGLKDPQGDELEWVREKLDIAIWLAARMKSDDAQDWKSYSVLWSLRISYTSTLTITQTLSQMRAEAKKQGKELYRTIGSSPIFEIKPGDGNLLKLLGPAKGIVPVLKGPSANDVSRKSAPKMVYAGSGD